MSDPLDNSDSMPTQPMPAVGRASTIELTRGLLDGLIMTPVVGLDGGVKFLDLTFRDMPGVRMVLEAEAVREIQIALDHIMGPAKK